MTWDRLLAEIAKMVMPEQRKASMGVSNLAEEIAYLCFAAAGLLIVGLCFIGMRRLKGETTIVHWFFLSIGGLLGIGLCIVSVALFIVDSLLHAWS